MPHLRARRGKNDAIDAEAAARKVLSGEATAAAKDTTGIVEAIRQLSVARNSAVKARAAALCQLGDLLVTAPAALREQLDTRRTLEGKASVCARLRPDPDRLADPAQAAKAALRSLGRRINQLGAEAAELEGQLDRLVAAAAPTTVSRLGCGTPRPYSSPQARTSTGSAPRRPSLTCAQPRRSPHQAGAPAATGSTSQATAPPTEPCT